MNREKSEDTYHQKNSQNQPLFNEIIIFHGGCLVFQIKGDETYCTLIDYLEDSIRPDSMDTYERIYKGIKLES